MATDRYILELAIENMRYIRAEYDAYLERCAEDYSKGFRARTCEHGTNNWTDYDNICGACERGETVSDPLALRRMALDWAHGEVAAEAAAEAAAEKATDARIALHEDWLDSIGC